MSAKEIVIVTSEFPPEPGVSGRMACDLADYLAGSGHRVTVICPYPSRPSGAVYPEYPPSGVREERRGEVRVTRVPSIVSPPARFGPRVLESWSFGWWSSRMLARHHPRPDVVYSVTWPMLAQAWTGLTTARLRVPHISHIMDLYPESAFLKMSNLTQRVTRGPLLALDRWNAWRAQRLLVISENMRQAYIRTRGLPASRVEVVRTWQDESLFERLPTRAEAAEKYGVQAGRFSFLFLGNMGPVAGVEHLIESFALAGLSEDQLALIGEGTEKARCAELARNSGAKVAFLSDRSIESIPWLQSLGDVCLPPVRRGAALSSIPSKLSSYMLSAKPVLASVDLESESARVIMSSGCGWVVAPEDAKALSEKMREVKELGANELGARGRRGRHYALEHLSKSRGVERLARIILEAVGTNGCGRIVKGEEEPL